MADSFNAACSLEVLQRMAFAPCCQGTAPRRQTGAGLDADAQPGRSRTRQVAVLLRSEYPELLKSRWVWSPYHHDLGNQEGRDVQRFMAFHPSKQASKDYGSIQDPGVSGWGRACPCRRYCRLPWWKDFSERNGLPSNHLTIPMPIENWTPKTCKCSTMNEELCVLLSQRFTSISRPAQTLHVNSYVHALCISQTLHVCHICLH